MSVFVISIIRTWVPILVGGAVAWLVAMTGLPIPEEASASLVIFITMVAIGLYYLLIRWLEQRFPSLGWFLGFAKAPALYVNPDSIKYAANSNIDALRGISANTAVTRDHVHPEFMTREQLADRTPGPDHSTEN